MTRIASARVHIIDDDELVRARMSHLLYNRGYSTEIYTGGPEFFRACRSKRGCILLDLRMPEMCGYDVLKELGRLGWALPVVAMSACGNLSAVVRAMKLGAVDFIAKPASEEELLAAVDRALASTGGTALRRNPADAAAARLDRLTSREREILQGLLDGLSNKEIARRLGLSPRTVEMHRASMKTQLGVKSLSEAVQLAVEAALTPLRQYEGQRAAAAPVPALT
ncbi:MAG TPA: response regulator [Allosphingosinicella sp.]|nr:response regulator [Allosphingosinicella sp.]